MWVRVESRSRVGRYYWKRTDASASQWSTPPARELLDATASCNGALAAAPRVLLREACGWLDPASLARLAATHRGGFAVAAAPDLWAPKLAGPCAGDPLLAFGAPANRFGLDEAADAARGSGARPQKPAPARAALDKLCRDPCVRDLVAGGLLSVDDLRQCAMRFAARCARGASPKPLSPNSAKKHSSVLRHVVLEDDFLFDALKKRSPLFAPYRRSHTLAALDALGPEPTRLGVATLEAHAGKDDALAFAVYNAERLKRSCVKYAACGRPRPSSAPCCPCRRRSGAASPSGASASTTRSRCRAPTARASRPP
ncbi:hypothetical protein JL720_10590 [Aureococcus anophagefferens]|nr:hypothetical protein JL720_10590 [Aureococcus anophagefferens]